MKDREKVASILVFVFAIAALFMIVNGYLGGELVSFGNYPDREATSENFENYEVAMEYYVESQEDMTEYFDVPIENIETSEFMENRPDEFGKQAISSYILQKELFVIEEENFSALVGALNNRSISEELRNYFEGENEQLENSDVFVLEEDKKWKIGSQNDDYVLEKDNEEITVSSYKFAEDTGAANSITAILWDYRGYDTLGEATVIFVAVAAIAALFRSSKDGEDDE
mgnify:CR=1 FL=1